MLKSLMPIAVALAITTVFADPALAKHCHHGGNGGGGHCPIGVAR